MSAARDPGLRLISGVATTVINGSIFVGMAYAGMLGNDTVENPEPPVINVEILALPKKGIEKDPKQLVRITQPPPPPEPETDAVNLARKKAEEEEEKRKLKEEEKKKRELAEQQRRLEEEERKRAEKQKRDAERKAREDRQKRMNQAMAAVRDPRADEDLPEGFKDGDENGTSTDPNALLAKSAYVSLVSTVLQRQFEVPAVVSASERARLEAHVHLRIDAQGKLKGEPKLVKRSGNKFFDDAALRTAMRFGAGSELRIPLPPAGDKDLRRLVLKEGITARMKAK
ncbi:MAG: TonB C-terminal domain-containing protein [Myxococcales bacterium]|nr:TonB C-terminal domain-containing protein [Myxococcales bacterium]MCB9526612.1 TonB C-terminal domain-containing protein [Myxococcales bacterium]